MSRSRPPGCEICAITDESVGCTNRHLLHEPARVNCQFKTERTRLRVLRQVFLFIQVNFPTHLRSHQTQECVGVRNATPTGVPLRRDIGDWGKQGLRARGQRTLLKVHASAHERVLAVVVTGVTTKAG